MAGTWDFPSVTCIIDFVIMNNDCSYKFKSLVGYEDMTNCHGGGCQDPTVPLHFCITVDLNANRA